MGGLETSYGRPETVKIHPLIAVCSRWLIVLVFLLAGGSKILQPRDLIEGVHQMPGFSGTPAFLILAIPVFEILLAIGLIFRFRERACWLASSILMTVFTIWLGWGWASGAFASCGCFGDLVEMPMPCAILRNLILLVISVWQYRRLRDS
jgi:uncharacterized membrane protein YphA (DoxX/SURF4 family)